MPPTATTFPPSEDPNPRRYPNTMALSTCPCASVYPQMPCRCYNPDQVSVCQINGKTYWTGTIMQTNEIMDHLCPKNSGSACWLYDPGYTVNSPLDPHLYWFSMQLFAFLMTPAPSWPGIVGFALPLGAPWYLATPIPMNKATAMGTPIDTPLQQPILRAIELTQKTPECLTNDGGTEPVGNLARDQCNQTLKGEWPTHPPRNTIRCCPHQGLFVGQLFTYVYQPIGWVSAP